MEKRLVPKVPGLKIRYSCAEDATWMKKWFSEKEVLNFFSMRTEREIDHAIQNWIYFHKMKASLTAIFDDQPCGIATLFLHPYQKILHHSEFGMIIDQKMRNRGIGSDLLCELLTLARDKFSMEFVHLQACGHNPALRLYRRLGFKQFGRQERWIKEENRYTARVLMEFPLSKL